MLDADSIVLKIEAVGLGVLDKVGSAFSGLSKNVEQPRDELGRFVKSADDAGKAADDLGGKADGLGSKLGSIAGGAAKFGLALGAAGVAAVGAFGASSVGVFADFEQALNGIKAVSDNLSEDSLKQLEDRAIELGVKFPISTTDAANGFGELAKAGFNANEILDASNGLVTLGVAGQLNMARSAEILGGTVRGFGLDTSETNKVVDILAQTANASAVDLTDLGESFKYVAPVAHGMGLTLEDMSIALGVMGNNMIKGSDAGTALRSMLTRLAAPPKDAAAAMEKLGLKVTDADGKMRPFGQIVNELRAKFAGLSDAEKIDLAKKLAGQEAMAGLLAMVNTSQEAWDDMANSVEGAEGAAQRMADTMSGGTKGAIENLKGTVEALQIKFGKALKPAIDAVIGGLASLIDKLGPVADWLGGVLSDAVGESGGLFQQLANIFQTYVLPAFNAVGTFVTGTLIPAFQQFAGWVAAQVYPIIESLGNVFVNVILPALLNLGAFIMDTVIPALGQVATWIGTNVVPVLQQFAAFIADTVIPVLGKIGAFIIENVLPALFQIGQVIATIVAPVLEKIASFIGSHVIPALQAIAQWIGDNVIPALKAFGGWLNDNVMPIVKEAARVLGEVLGKAFDVLGALIEKIWPFMSNVISGAWIVMQGIFNAIGEAINILIGVWNNLSSGVQTVWNNISGFVSGAWDTISGTFNTIISGITGGLTEAWNGLTTTVKNVWDTITGAVRTGVDKVGEIMGDILKFFKELPGKILDLVANAGSWLLDTGKKIIEGLINGIMSIHIPTPHLNISWHDVDGPLGFKIPMPDFDLKWYAKGGIFSGAQVIGVGEKGPEAVLPIDKLVPLLSDALKQVTPQIVPAQAQAGGPSNVTITSYNTYQVSVPENTGGNPQDLVNALVARFEKKLDDRDKALKTELLGKLAIKGRM